MADRLREIADEVLKTIEDRRADYGDPLEMFEDTGERWGASPLEVALRLADIKMARLS